MYYVLDLFWVGWWSPYQRSWLKIAATIRLYFPSQENVMGQNSWCFTQPMPFVQATCVQEGRSAAIPRSPWISILKWFRKIFHWFSLVVGLGCKGPSWSLLNIVDPPVSMGPVADTTYRIPGVQGKGCGEGGLFNNIKVPLECLGDLPTWQPKIATYGCLHGFFVFFW